MKLKQLSKLFLAAIVATTSLSLTSCNNDTKETPIPKPTDAQMLVGTWKMTAVNTNDGPGVPTDNDVYEFTNDNDAIFSNDQGIIALHYTLADRVISLSEYADPTDNMKWTITKLDETSLVMESTISDPVGTTKIEYTFEKIPTKSALNGLPFAGAWKVSRAFNTATGDDIPLSNLSIKALDIKLIDSGFVNVTTTTPPDDLVSLTTYCFKPITGTTEPIVIGLYTSTKFTTKLGDLTIQKTLDQGKKLQVTIDLFKGTTLELTR